MSIFEKAITIAGSIIAGFIVYSVLSYILVASKISIPISIVMSVLIFGLTKYYSNYSEGINLASHLEKENNISNIVYPVQGRPLSSILFVTIFVILILVSASTSKQIPIIFTDWSDVGTWGLIQLGAAIMLCFFMPGYAIALMITKNCKISHVGTVLLGYLLSILLTGLIAYISVLSFDISFSEIGNIFIIVYLGIIATFFISNIKSTVLISKVKIEKDVKQLILTSRDKLYNYVKYKAPELLVFASLFMLLIICTYIMYGGTTIGDQWFHQGRALLFMSGSFREAIASNTESIYPPFQSALLASLTYLSGIPLVNAYASIAFLNIIPVFAFYYFFCNWVSRKMQKAGLLASALIMISSGFGWIYLLSISVPVHSITSQQSVMDILDRIRPLDIIATSNFIIPTAPDFSTALIYIALPAGFFLLAMARKIIRSKFASSLIIAAISILGIMSHDEFYIFIIVASLAPLFFKLKERDYLYLGLLIAFSIVYIIDVITPGKIFTSNYIGQIPLFYLSIIFVVISWMLYWKGEYLYSRFKSRSFFLTLFKKTIVEYGNPINSVIRILVVAVVLYLYLLSFVVIAQLPVSTIQSQASDSSVPWYLYPMRMGLVGLLGLVLVLSFLFKKFEREVFIFALLIIIPLIASPYYNESRFSKYVMLGTIGFASLLSYRILERFSTKPVYNHILITAIVLFSGLSILIFVGYNSLILQTKDYYDTLPRRHFPSMTELNLFRALHDKIDLHAEQNNVVSFPSEYNRWRDGAMPKIQGFSGLPSEKLLGNSPLVLNTSTLESFYHQLDTSNAKYMLVRKPNLFGKILTDPTQFALSNFPHTLDFGNYQLIAVPPIRGPSNLYNDVAIVYDNSIAKPPIPDNKRTLQFNNSTFNHEDNNNTKFIDVLRKNQSESTNISGTKIINETTLWSKNLDKNEGINYFRVRFKITDENSTDSVGILWLEGNRIYGISISGNGLELKEQYQLNNASTLFLSQNFEVTTEPGIWYLIKVAVTEDSIYIYVDNELKIKVPRSGSGIIPVGVSKIGINHINNTVEFEPIQIGKVSTVDQFYDKKANYNYYYPLSLLALSGTGYDSFAASDYSILSKKTIILTSDPQNMPDTLYQLYLDYAKSGGRLIVMNPDDKFNGKFSKLLSIFNTGNESQQFSRIAGEHNLNQFINISGIVKSSRVSPSQGVNVIATYRDGNNKVIAPFAVEKEFSNTGKIILVNNKAYFNSIFNNPGKYFLTLSNISNILDLGLDRVPNLENVSTTLKGFIGNMEISGEATLDSSSFALLNSSGISNELGAEEISIYDNGENIRSLKNISIENLRLSGQYEISIHSNGTVMLPSKGSISDYVAISIPNKFNMTAKLLNNQSHAEIVTNNHSRVDTIEIGNESKIVFSNIKTITGLNSTAILMKSPEIEAIGNTSFQNAISSFLTQRGTLDTGSPLDVRGRIKAKIDFVDHYTQPIQYGTKTRYLTYLQRMIMDGKIDEHAVPLKLPGDISYRAKLKQLDIPWKSILISDANIVLLTSLTIATVMGSWLLRSKIKSKR